MSGAEPWIGSYSPNGPCAVRRSPSEADGSIPRLPARTDASSERMSPNRFSVTSTSNDAGPSDEEHRARVDELVVRPRRPGSSASTSSTTCRQRRDVARTLALSTLVRRPRRPRASSKPSRTTRRISASVYDSVSIGRAPPVGPVALLALAEVEAAGQLADDQQVDAVEQLGPERRRRDEAGWTVTGRRFANSSRPPRSANSACSGRTGADGSSHLRPADGAEQDRVAPRRPRVDVLRPDRDAVGVDRRAAGERRRPLDRRSRTPRPTASSDAPRRRATTSGPTPSPGIGAIR